LRPYGAWSNEVTALEQRVRAVVDAEHADDGPGETAEDETASQTA
jgi:hypothetical protein